MNISEVFELKNITGDVKKAVSEIEIDKMLLSKNSATVILQCHSDNIIHPYIINQLETAITYAYFKNTGKSVLIQISFPFETNVNPEYLWNNYKDMLIYSLGLSHKYESYIASDADTTFTDNGIILDVEDNFLAHKSMKSVTALLHNKLKEWFNADINISFVYHKPTTNSETLGNASYEIYDPAKYRKRKAEEYVPADLKTVNKSTQSARNTTKSTGKETKFRKKIPTDPDIIYGRAFEGELFSINELADGLNDIIIKGMISSSDTKELKNERILLALNVTDFTDTIGVKIFTDKEELDTFKKDVSEGCFIMLKGRCAMDTFDHTLSVTSVQGIKRIPDFRKKRVDTATETRVELHAHTQMSDMDAVTNTTEFVKTAFEWGHKAVAITDHGVVQSFPEASHALNKKKYENDPEKLARFKEFKIIYGCEAYLVNDDDLVDEEGNPKIPEAEYREEICKRKYFHIILLCKNDLGRSNLYKLVSDSHLKYFRRRPKMPKSVLKKNREGLIIGSACEAGELFRAILNKESEEYINHIAELYDYYEVQPTGNNNFLILDNERYPEIKTVHDLENLNCKIIELADKHQKLCVATCDVHFLNPEDEIYRRIIMAGKGFADADRQPPLYFRTTEEMLAEFSYLSQEKAFEICVTNTNKIADMIEKIAPVRPDKCPPVIENSDNDLREMCYARAKSMYGENLPELVKTRLDKELNSIIGNGYSVMYIIAQKLVKKSNDDGYLVGSRGSVGSSFAATMSGITEVNPLPPHYYCTNCFYTDFNSEIIQNALENQLSGFDLPDRTCPVCGARLHRDGQNIPFETFLGFYGDKEPDIDLNFSGEYQGKAHAYTEVIFGEGHTFKAGTIGTLADKTAFGFIKKYYEERGIEKRTAEIDRIVKGCVGVRRTTGQHPGGIVVLPHGEEIYTFTPVQHPANDMTSNIITTHFDYHSIDHNLLKLDILGHDDPTMIRFLEDLTGEDAKTWPMDDPKVISLFQSCDALGVTKEQIGCELGSLGLPELGTNFVMNMLKETKPKSFSDMIRISGLSHGTDVWTNNAQELVKTGQCTLSTAICTRDDIMTYLILKGVEAGKAFKIMESVRKGKGLTDEMEATMKEKNIPDWYIWSCKKIKYMFPKAHACAYVMMAFRIAYCKVYHPLAYYAAYFSIRADNFDYEMMAQGLPHLQKCMDEIDIKIKNKTATPKESGLMDDMMLVREMYCRGFDFVPIDIYKAKANRFQIIDGKLMPSLITINGMGGKAADMVECEAAKAPFVSRNEFKNRCKVPSGVVDTMNELELLSNLPEDEQLSFMDLFNDAGMF
ncbi:MAG: PolC-type DNA polymerase III [Lachnospiraceae bacterium]